MSPGTSPSAGPAPSEDLDLRFVVAVGITVVAILSQYFVPQTWAPAQSLYGNLPGDLLVVYGIPVVAFSFLVGAGPLRGWAGRMGSAAFHGLKWYGALSFAALLVTLVLIAVYESVDPSALQLLSRPNPALTAASGDPWFWIGFSFVVGAFEETIFRGWIFGYWQGRATDWRLPAVGSSAIFAGVHLYYGTTYGAASPLIFPMLFAVGFAFALTYRQSGGNLVVIAFLHGLFDASAFYSLINPTGALVFRYVPMLVGLVLFAGYYLTHESEPVFPASPGDASDQRSGERISSIQSPSGPSK